jgi:acyl-CoA reductase-like NAD-dependent aldehyde dehydrogenase
MRETFALIVYVLKTKSLEQAIDWNNEVDQGLSSALFTKNIGSTFKWITVNGSDCGIVNINTSPSGKLTRVVATGGESKSQLNFQALKSEELSEVKSTLVAAGKVDLTHGNNTAVDRPSP